MLCVLCVSPVSSVGLLDVIHFTDRNLLYWSKGKQGRQTDCFKIDCDYKEGGEGTIAITMHRHTHACSPTPLFAECK